MTTRPSDDHLLKIFGLQLDSNLAKTHEFYVEYSFGTRSLLQILNEPTKDCGSSSKNGSDESRS